MTISLSFKSWEKDVNLDGKYDSLHFNIEVPLADSEAIHSVQLLLIFDYQLHVSEILNLDSTGHPRAGYFCCVPLASQGRYTQGILLLKHPKACSRGTLWEQSSSVCANDFVGILHPQEQNFPPAKCSTIFNRLNIWEQAPGANWANLKMLPRVYYKMSQEHAAGVKPLVCIGLQSAFPL